MKNWMGQVIQVGDTVYRGARDGNTSSYKVGVVRKTDPKTEKVSVEWFFELGGLYNRPHGETIRNVPRRPGYWANGKTSTGTCGINTLVHIDPNIFDELGLRYEAAQRAQTQEEYEKLSKFYTDLGYVPMP